MAVGMLLCSPRQVLTAATPGVLATPLPQWLFWGCGYLMWRCVGSNMHTRAHLRDCDSAYTFRRDPLILPMYHSGMSLVLPFKAFIFRVGRTITVNIGECCTFMST